MTPKPKTKSKQAVAIPVWKPGHSHKRLKLATLIILFVGLALFGTHQLQLEIQHHGEVTKFNAIEKDLATQYKAVTATIGQPVEMHIVKDCGHTHLKAGNGALGCGVDYYFFYPVASQDEGKAMALKLRPLFERFNDVKSAYMTPSNLWQITTSLQYTHTRPDNVSCGYSYNLEDASLHNDNVGHKIDSVQFDKPTNSVYAAEFSIGCGKGDVAKPIYTIDDSY